MATMMRDFHMTRREAYDELPLLQAFAFSAWATEANPWVKINRLSDGYVAQEIERLDP